MDAAGFFRVLNSTKSFFCFRSILHENLKVMPHTAHRLSLLSATRSSSIRRHLARSSTAHVESSDTMRSRKAQCQAPPDNPETGDTYHSRERTSCAGEKIEHQNGYKSGTAATVQCTSSLLITCAHIKLNVKHHRTTPKPETRITADKAEAALARK